MAKGKRWPVLSRSLKLGILASCTLLMPLFLLPSPVSAATVTVPINISIMDAGAPPFAWTIGGSCSPSPSTGSTGVTVNVNMMAGCAFILYTPADGPTQRDRFVSSTGFYVSGLEETSCSTSPCSTLTISAHVEELLTVSTNCYDPYVTPASQSGDSWYDYGTTLTVSCLGVWDRSSGTGVRATSWDWDGGATTSVATLSGFTSTSKSMTSAHTFYVGAGAQFQLGLDTGAIRALISVTSTPIKNDLYWYDAGTLVSYVGNGVFGRGAEAGNRSTGWYLDSRMTTQLTTADNFTVQVDMNTTHTLHVPVATQYRLTLDSGALAANASITRTPIAGDAYWYDGGTLVTYTGNGAYGRSLGAGERVSGWQLDSGEVTPVLTTAPFSVSIKMTSAHSLHITAVSQFQVELIGSYAIASATAPTIPGDKYWYDNGTVVTLSLRGVFNRTSGTGERMTSYRVNTGVNNAVATSGPVSILNSFTLTLPFSVSAQAVTQYQLTLDRPTLNALVSVTPPAVGGDDYWYDLGTAVTLTLNGEWGRNMTEGSRLTSYTVDESEPIKVATAGSVTIDLGPVGSPRSVSSTEAAQYFLSVSGGAGISYSPNPPIPMDTGWYDSGTAVSVSSGGAFDANGSTRQGVISWAIDGAPSVSVETTPLVTTSPIAMDSPHSVAFGSVTQYLVAIHLEDNSGTVPLSKSAIIVSANGTKLNAMGGTIWVDSGTRIQIESANWNGVDVTPSNTNAYTVTSPIQVVLDVRAYEAHIAVRDVFGFGIGGATYSITFANRTIIHGTTPSNGVITLGVVPLGTFEGTVNYLGTTSTFSGDASTNSTTTVKVPLSYAIIGILVAVVVASILVVVYLRRRPHAPYERW